MARKVYRQIIELVRKAARLARTAGIPNLLQPGLVKEMIVADILGHEPIATKHDADACDPQDESVLYEYLSCKEGGTGQLDRMFKEPPADRAKSLKRITRSRRLYFAVFFKADQTKVKVIYELEPRVVLDETKRRLDRSKNAISHVGFTEKWARANGIIVYEAKCL